jgi:hypothetical protein
MVACARPSTTHAEVRFRWRFRGNGRLHLSEDASGRRGSTLMPISTDLGVNPGTPMVASVRHIIEGRERALDALSARRRSVLHRRLSDHGKAVRQGAELRTCL